MIQLHVKGFADKGIVSKYAVPKKVIFVKSIERTSVGEINNKQLREMHQHAEQAELLRPVRGDDSTTGGGGSASHRFQCGYPRRGTGRQVEILRLELRALV